LDTLYVNRWLYQICEGNDVTNILANKYYQTRGITFRERDEHHERFKPHKSTSVLDIYNRRSYYYALRCKTKKYKSQNQNQNHTRPLCHKLIIKLLDMGLIKVHYIWQVSFGSVCHKYLIQYCEYALRCNDTIVQSYWLEKLAKQKINKQIRDNFFHQFYRIDPTLLGRLIYYDSVLLFVLENNIEPILEDCKIKVKECYYYNRIYDTFSTRELLIWILNNNRNTSILYTIIPKRIKELKNYDMIKIFLNHTSRCRHVEFCETSQNDSERKLKLYVKHFFPVCYYQFIELFAGARSNILTKFIQTKLNFLVDVIGFEYCADDIYYLILLQPPLQRQKCFDIQDNFDDYKIKCSYKYESNNPAIKLVNSVIYNQVLHNDSIELLSKIRFTIKNKIRMVKFLIHLFDYYNSKHSETVDKRIIMVDVLLKIIGNDRQPSAELFQMFDSIIYDVYKFGFDSNKQFSGNLYYVMKKKVAKHVAA